MDGQCYEQELQSAYQEHLVKYGQSFFEGQLDEGADTDAQGNEITITPEELEDDEDELIRLMHKRFLDGEDLKWVDYDQIDNDCALDDRRQME